MPGAHQVRSISLQVNSLLLVWAASLSDPLVFVLCAGIAHACHFKVSSGNCMQITMITWEAPHPSSHLPPQIRRIFADFLHFSCPDESRHNHSSVPERVTQRARLSAMTRVRFSPVSLCTSFHTKPHFLEALRSGVRW